MSIHLMQFTKVCFSKIKFICFLAGLRVLPKEVFGNRGYPNTLLAQQVQKAGSLPFGYPNGLLAKIKQHLTPKKKRELSVKVCSRFRFCFIRMFFIFADENFIIKSSTQSVYLPAEIRVFFSEIRLSIISFLSSDVR